MNTVNSTVRLVVVDDHEVVRSGLRVNFQQSGQLGKREGFAARMQGGQGGNAEACAVGSWSRSVRLAACAIERAIRVSMGPPFLWSCLVEGRGHREASGERAAAIRPEGPRRPGALGTAPTLALTRARPGDPPGASSRHEPIGRGYGGRAAPRNGSWFERLGKEK